MPLNLDSALRGACDTNARAALAAIARATPGGTVVEVGTSLIVRTGMPVASLNPVFALARVRDPERLAAEIRARLVAPQLPWMLVTTPDARLGLTPVLDSFGLVRRRVLPVMVLDLEEDLPGAGPPGLQTRRATVPEEVRQWARTFEQGVDAPPGILTPWVEGLVGPSSAAPAPWQFYVGLVDGAPVATAARFTSGPIAGVYFVQTAAAHRRHGYGRALTAAAADARAAGCAVSCLQSTAMGRPLYESMGYRAISEYEFWQAPGPTDTPAPARPGL